MFESQKSFSHKKFLVTKKFQSQNQLSHKNILLTKEFQSQQIFSHKKILVTKKLQPQKIFSHKCFKSQKKFCHKKILVTKKIESPKIKSEFFLVANKFQSQNSFHKGGRTNQPTDGSTTRLLELLRAAKKRTKQEYSGKIFIFYFTYISCGRAGKKCCKLG